MMPLPPRHEKKILFYKHQETIQRSNISQQEFYEKKIQKTGYKGEKYDIK